MKYLKIFMVLISVGATRQFPLSGHDQAEKMMIENKGDNDWTNPSKNWSLNNKIVVGVELMHPLDNWLNNHVQVAQAIKWNVDKYTYDIRSYDQWPHSLKEELFALYDDLLMGGYPTYKLPLSSLQDYEGYGFTILSDADAQHVYLSFLATALYHEIHSKFNWSILDYSEISLDSLFNWKEYLSVWNYAGTGFVPRFVIKIQSTPASPEYLKKAFIDEYNIIANTDKQTFANILGYARDSLQHYIGNNNYDHWQYNGSAPMSKVIEGSTHIPTNMFHHWIGGCHGTVSFSKWIGFWLNIPVHASAVGYGHRIAILPSIDSMFISHGDDPYSQVSKEPNIASHHFLINKIHFDDYFGSSLSNAEQNKNVSKRVSEISLDHLPRTYLFTYNLDYYLNGNLTWDNSLWTTNTGLSEQFDSIMLDSFQFWDRIHHKISEDPEFHSWSVPAPEGFEPPVNIQWKEFNNAIANEDSTAFLPNSMMPMTGVSETYLDTNDWVEMVVYNAAPDTWLGLSVQDSFSNIEVMDFAIRIEDNIVSCFHNGDQVAVISDEYNMTVNWLKLSLVNKQVRFSLNRDIKHKIEIRDLPLNKYNVHFGGQGEGVEVNNIYTSSSSSNLTCSYNQELDNTEIYNNVYKAENLILSNGLIPQGGDVTFQAGNAVWLDKGFEVEGQSKFTIMIKFCDAGE